MKILSEATLTKFVDTSFEESQVVVVRSQWLDDLAKEGEEAPVLPRATIVNLSDNKLTSASIQRLWQMFPSAWWIDLSDNNIKDFDFPLPVVLGSLSLTGNTMDAKELETLAKVHILRIKLTPLSAVSVGLSSKAAGVTLITTKLLPNVWVVNDDFISFSDRVRSTKFHLSQQNIETGEAAIGEVTSINITVPQRITAGDWSAIRASPKASSLACVLQEIALSTPESDFFRLDVLLEDYLEEASIYNKFVRKLQIFNNSAVKPLPFMPIVDIQELVELPHRLRLDLSAALTASLLFHIPPILFKEALITAMLKHLSLKSMETMLKLPAFVKTAVVCLLRRLCKRELEEIRITQTLVPKPRAVGGLSNPCTYVTADGFNYLRPARKYLERDITVPEYHEECQSPTLDPSNPASPLYFSDLELDMLDNLPDTPTISSSAEAVHDLLDAGRKGVALDTDSEVRNIESQKDWISFVARHVVLMLTQAPSCPSLTRQQTSKVGQDLYFEMLPLLKAASMTLQDMGIQYSGPGVDGRTAIGTIQSVGTYRILSALDSVAGGKESKDTNSSLMMTTTADKLFGGFLLPFGAGLPHGGVQTLSWQIEEVKRDYAKPWNDYLDPAKTQSQKPGSPLITDEDEDDKCRFFLTGEGRSLNVRSNSSSPTAKRGPLVSPSSNVRPPVFRMDDDESKLLSMSSPRIDQPDQRLPEPHIRAGMLAVRSKSRSFSFEGEDVRIFTDTLNSASLISRGKIGPLSDRSTLSALPSLIEGCDRTIWTPTKSRTSIAMAGDDLLSIRTGNSDLVDIEAMSKSIALVSIPHTTSDHQFAQMRIFNTDDMDLIDPTTESVRLQPSLGVGEKRMSLRPIVTDLTDEEHRLNSKESASDDKIETSSFVPKLTSLDQPNDGDYLYDFRRSTENKDTKKMSQIAGFSADINWESTFLLAPVGKVSQYNNQVPRSAGWESIEKPPVVAMTNNCARIPISHAGDDLLASSSNKLLTTKILSRVTFSSAENGEHENSFTDNVRRSKVDVASIDDIPSQTVVINPIDLQSTETQSNHNGRASNAEEVISEYKTATSFYQIENQHQKPKLEVSVGEVAKRGAVPQQIFTRTERKIQQEEEGSAAYALLREMGTIKNMRFIHETESAERQRINRLKNSIRENSTISLQKSYMSTTVSADNISTVSGGHTADRSIQSGFLSLDVVKNKPKALPYTPMITNPPSRRSQSKAVAVKGKENNLDNKDSLQRVLMMLQQKKYEEVVTKSNDSSNMKHEKNSKNKSGIENIQTTFLTSVAEALDKLELEDKQESRIDADHLGELKEESITNRSVFLEEEIIENPDSQLYNSISPVEFVKLKTNYNNIFTTNGLIEQGDRGVNGQVISPSWYPCDTKTVYRLSLNSLTSELYNLKGNSSTNDLDYNNPEEISPALAHNERLQNPFFVVLNQKPLTPPSQTQGLRDNRKSRPLQTKLFDNTDLTAVNSYWSNESLSDTSSIAFKKPKKIDRRKAAGVDMLKSSPYFRSITTPDRANSPKSIDLNRTKDTFRKPRSSFRHQPASIENFQLGSTIPECGPPWLENSVCPLMTNKDPNDGLVRDKWGLKEEEASKNILKVSGEVDDDKAKRIEKTMILKDKFDLRTDCGTTIKGSVQSNLKSSTSVCTKKKTTVAPGAILTSNRNNLVNETQAPPPSFYNDSFPKSYLTDLDSSERPLTLSCTNTPISSRRNLQNDHRSISGFSLNSSIQTAVASERSRIDADSAMKAFKSNSKQFFLTGAALFTIADGSASAITPSGTPALSIVISERQSVSKSPAVSPAYRSSPTVRPDGNCVYLLDQQEEMPPTHTSKARHQLCNDSADVLRSSDLHQVEDDNIAPDHASASLASDHEMLSLFSSKPMRKTSQSPKEREHGHTPEMVTTPPVINSFSAISDSGLKQTVSDPQGNHEKDIDTDSVAESEGSFDTSSGSFTMSHGSGKDPNQLYDAYASNLENARISSDKRGETKRSYSNPGIKVVYASKNGKRVVSSGEGIIVDGYTGAIDGRNPRLGGARDIFRDMRGAVRGDTASFVDPLTGKRKKVTIPNIGYTKPHREFRISGQIRNPWVGKDRYRAATTKLSLNRSFKQRLPSLDHVTDKLDKTH